MTEIWDDAHRKLAWLVMIRMRLSTNTEVNPTIANAYVYLQKYFHSNTTVDYDLYIIIISALVVAFKNEDLKCDIRRLFIFLLRACYDYEKNHIYSQDEIISLLNISSLEQRNISTLEESKVNDCEMDLLEALNYETHVDLPFYCINTCLYQYVNTTDPSSTTEFYLDPKALQDITKDFELNVIKFFSAVEYLELPPPLIATISLLQATKGKEIPSETTRWIEETRREYGQEEWHKVASVFIRQIQYLKLQPKKQ